ncbi:MAG TPA: SH3 domain-containing protein, partial [Candidatus Glassbacteria bacterium]|nr:SH3 domain-containing protein [Candidatus Glassbacteria bacterium]
MMVTNRYATVRKGPGAGYDMVATLYQGDRLLAEKKFRNWFRVTIHDGRLGWVREDLVGPYDPNQRDLTNEEADSLKQLVDSRTSLIATLEDSSRREFTSIQNMETIRDSLMALLGLAEMPSMQDTTEPAGGDTIAMMLRPGMVSPYTPQKTVLGAREGFHGRATYSPRLGVLISKGEATAAADFSYEMNFTREFSYKVDLTTAAFSPALPGMAESSVNHVFATAGLAYSYEPGNLAVPYVEIGAGTARTASGDSTATNLALVFGAGFRLYFTPDFALEMGYRGNAIMSEDNELLGMIYMGGGILLPRHVPLMVRSWKGSIYVSPFAGYQAFSPRFSFNGTGVVGVR